jgi:hypothetical protein
LKILEFKHIKQRILVWQFKLDFPEKRVQQLKVFKCFEDGFDEVRNSKNFKKVLSMILSIGNVLNGGTTKG